MAALAERIAAVCIELERGDLEVIAADAGAGPFLARILSALRTGESTDGLEDDLDALDEALVRYGIDGGLLPDQRAYRPSPAALEERPLIELWVCPTGQCSRKQVIIDWRANDQKTPLCAVTGALFHRKRLAT